MKKIAIFAEGQSEHICVRYFLPLIFGWEKISFQCFKLHANQMTPAPFLHPNEHAEIDFLIVNVGNDESVLSAVKEREKELIQPGYGKIIALRDMYSEKYCKRAQSINDAITEDFINGAQQTIRKMDNSDKIKMCFAIMELEAWFLGIYNVFKRLNPALTIAYIEENIGFNLAVIDPQTEFFKPADIVDNILQLVGLRYNKSQHDVESICSKIDINDFSNAFENKRCISFKNLYDEVLN